MKQLTLGAPNEKQRQFLLDRHRHIAYGGARGGGKSWAVRTKAKLLALRYPGIKILIVRRSLRELQNNHIPAAAGAGADGKIPRGRQAVRISERVDDLLWLLRVRRGHGAVSGRGI